MRRQARQKDGWPRTWQIRVSEMYRRTGRLMAVSEGTWTPDCFLLGVPGGVVGFKPAPPPPPPPSGLKSILKALSRLLHSRQNSTIA